MFRPLNWTFFFIAITSELCLAQGLQELTNGTIADAEVLNQNFAANNEIIESVEGRVESLEAQVRGRGCSVSDLEGPWLTTYAEPDEFRYTIYTFTATGQGGVVEFEYSGVNGGLQYSGDGTGFFSFNSELCEVQILSEIASPAETISAQGYLSQSKDALLGIACSSLTGCRAGNAFRVRLGEPGGSSSRLADLGLLTPEN